MIARALAGALVVLLTSALVLAPQPPAQAAQTPGVPPDALGECAAPATAGGWDDRDQTSDGTDSTADGFPVRPMIMRLGEPCYLPADHPNGPDWANSLAYVITDRSAPVPPIDEDEDGEDDGLPSDGVVVCNQRAPLAVTGPGATPECNRVEMWRYGPGQTSADSVRWETLDVVSATPAGTRGVTLTVERTWTGAGCTPGSGCNADSGGTARVSQLRAICIAPGGTTTVLATDSAAMGTIDTTSTKTYTCAGSSDIVVVVGVTGVSAGGQREGTLYAGGLYTATPPGGYYGGTQSAAARHGGVDVGTTATCAANYNGTSGVVEHDMAGSFEIYGSANVEADGWWGETRAYPLDFAKSLCPFLLSLELTICSYVGFGDGEACETHTWNADRFRDGAVYPGDDDPTVALCLIYPDSPGCYDVLNPGRDEDAIICVIEAEGDFFTFFGAWMAELPGWVGCMFLPVGWDRGGKIVAAWNSGPTGQFAAAFDAAIPNGIACGTLPGFDFYGQTITFDTCDADYAPGWAKSIVGWVIVLALAVLAIRRIMWSVGAGK